MTHPRILAVVLILAGFALPALAVDESTPLAVMTYNLRYASLTPPNAWPQRLPVAAAMINKYKPDIFGTQEGLYQQLKDLAAKLPDYKWIGQGRAGGSHDEFNAIFYRPERFEPQEYDYFWLSDTPEVVGSRSWGNNVRRMCTWIRFRDKQTDQQFYFVNTHLDHQVQVSREKSAELIRKRILALKPQWPIILVGDFNAAAGDNKAYDILTSDGTFKDSYLITKKHLGPAVGTFHNYKTPVPNGERIDWILTHGPFEVESTEIVTFEINGQHPSDHFPYMAHLKLMKSGPQ